MAISVEEELRKSNQTIQAANPVHKENDSNKMIHPWWVGDVLERHPDASPENRREEELLQTTTSPSKGGIVDSFNSLGNWLWGLVFPSNTTEQIDPKPVETTMVGNMELEEYQQFINDTRHLLARINDFKEELSDDLAFEALLAQIFKAQITEREEETQIHWESLVQNLEEKRSLNKERLDKLEESLNKQLSEKHWSQCAKVASILGITAAGLSVSTGVGAVVFLVGVGLAADSMADDWTKRKLVTLVTDDNQKQDKYTEALKLGAGVVSVAITMGLGMSALGASSDSALTALQAGLTTTQNVSQGSVAIGGGISKHQSNLKTADFKEVSEKIDKKTENMKRDTGKIQALVENVQHYYRNLSDIQRNQLETATAMIKG